MPINLNGGLMTRAEIDELADALDIKLYCLDGLDDAIIGYSPGFDGSEERVVYSYEKIIEIFVKNGMSYEEACEWVDFNVIGAKAPTNSPLIIRTSY
jgi:hypothetical protein